jgi:hypothetical protein
MNPSSSHFPPGLVAGAATADITPLQPVFLFGYPHVARESTGVHDPLECSAFYLCDGAGRALLLAHDLIFVPRALAVDARQRISRATGLKPDEILLSGTHTHSGPVTVDQVANAADPHVPKTDAGYLAWLCERIVETACRAVNGAVPAELGQAVAQAPEKGGNRHDPAGPSDPEVPVLLARSRETGAPIGCMVVHAMHPTVLHEDSTLISGDFPHFTREYLRANVLPRGCPVVYHNGASGDQSPRHIIRANTFSEAQRLGASLGRAIAGAMAAMSFTTRVRIAARRSWIELEPRDFPTVAAAEDALRRARERHQLLERTGASGPTVRTAECDVFGAEETVELARAAIDGRLEVAIRTRTPAEIQAIAIGAWTFVGWPGEFFVAYALALRAKAPGTFVITLANGELQGYIVTPEAAANRCYEAGNAVFAPANGRRFVDATLALIATESPETSLLHASVPIPPL